MNRAFEGAAAGLIPDLALVSPAVRARQTFEALVQTLPDVRLQVAPALYQAPAQTLRDAADHADADTLLVVAHNPGISVLAKTLIQSCVAADISARTALDEGFPTATAAAFEFVQGRVACLGVFRPAETA